jgi:hypothetical protein
MLISNVQAKREGDRLSSWVILSHIDLIDVDPISMGFSRWVFLADQNTNQALVHPCQRVVPFPVVLLPFC